LKVLIFGLFIRQLQVLQRVFVGPRGLSPPRGKKTRSLPLPRGTGEGTKVLIKARVQSRRGGAPR
jgi:hypothetical protein